MNNDLISRQAAIDLFNKLADDPWNANAYTTWSKAYSHAAEYIEELPSARQWIPVTERLPKEIQDVLLAFRQNMVVGFWEDILNDGGQAWYANSGNGWFTGTESFDDDGFPIAWMPLPEPWKGGDES